MEFFVFWLLFGAAFGMWAAQKRGYSLAIGAVFGAILGILAPLMLFVSGVSKGEQSKKCPDCAEFVKADAKVCKHCGCKLEQLKIAA
jgi:hypothetical protein